MIATTISRTGASDARQYQAGVAMTATVGGVPQKRGLITDADRARIVKAMEEREHWDAVLRESVLAAARHGASVRELSALTGHSTNTISRWKRGE